MSGWNKERMIEESKAVIKRLNDFPEDKKVVQISTAVIFEDGTTQTMHVTDLGGHALLVALQQAHVTSRLSKEMKL